MRSVSVDLAADIDDGCTSLARLWKITRTDGVILYFTDGDQPIPYATHVYRADVGFTASAVMITGDYVNAQSVTIKAAMTDDGIAEDDIRMKRYEGAKGELSIINYLAPSHGIMKVFTGTFGRVEVGDKNEVSIELTPEGSALGNHAIGSEVYSPTCRNSFGNVNCSGPDLAIDLAALSVAFTVDVIATNVITASEFTQADNQYAEGFILWVTGDNAGLRSPVARSLLSTHTVTLTQNPPKAIQVGDTGVAIPGCDKALDTCITKWNNVLNFRGEPNVPDTTFLPMTNIGAAPEGS